MYFFFFFYPWQKIKQTLHELFDMIKKTQRGSFESVRQTWIKLSKIYYDTSNDSNQHISGDSLGHWMFVWLNLKVTWDVAFKVSKWGFHVDAIYSKKLLLKSWQGFSPDSFLMWQLEWSHSQFCLYVCFSHHQCIILMFWNIWVWIFKKILLKFGVFFRILS